MISLNHLLNNPDIYRQELTKRFRNVDLVDQILQTHGKYKPAQDKLETLRQKKNQFNDLVISLQGEEKMAKITEMKEVSNQIKELEDITKDLHSQIQKLVNQIPNLTWEGMPVAKDSDGNVEIAQYGTKPEFDFEPLNYYDLPVFKRDYDSQKGVEAAGFRGFYIKGNLARLQKALFDWALERLIKKGFNYIIPPIFVNEDVMLGTGFFPDGREDCYTVGAGDREFYLPGTSEAVLMYYHRGETLDLLDPIKLTAYTRCFRKEAGAYGKDTKGGIRVNQFEKIETVFLCKPSQSYKVFDEMTGIFHETVDQLGLFYHDLETSTGDNGLKNHRMIDIEAWFPAQNTFREVCSSSNCTDYQTRTLNIKCEDGGETVLAHSLNCTGITNRTLFAIMEQFQQKDGRVKIPSVLVPYYGKEILD
jgi:seryl-tRNA synthetase